jgi:hypothetical protein
MGLWHCSEDAFGHDFASIPGRSRHGPHVHGVRGLWHFAAYPRLGLSQELKEEAPREGDST